MRAQKPPRLHTANPSPLTAFNRLFGAVYSLSLLSLFYRHINNLLATSPTTSLPSLFTTLTLLLSDLVLAFMWLATQAIRTCPVSRKQNPEELERAIEASQFPKLDVFICTADPYKEPPMGVVDCALSVMAYDYPPEKISVYVSDDGGSALTLFAFMEAARFAGEWLPFCRENDVLERSPSAYFGSGYRPSAETERIKLLYENMKERVESAVEKGKVCDEYVTGDEERKAFNKWNGSFTRQNHPTVIQVLLDKKIDEDDKGLAIPSLIYVTREKRSASHHNFKAGALNVLIRVSAALTNAPIILTLDCDMSSNDPQTPRRVLCYYSDPEVSSSCGYVQFPQKFKGVNRDDTYGSKFRRVFLLNPWGFDGLGGTNYVGTNAFFARRAFFGGPSDFVQPEIPELSPYHVAGGHIRSPEVLALAHKVASCDYEGRTSWGYKLGFRYGSLVEDLFTGYTLKCEGWRSIFCNPKRAAFLGDAPISLIDTLNQQKRWCVGLLEVGFSAYSPLTYGVKKLGLLLGLAYADYTFWPFWSIPITVYSFLPQLALLNKVSIFPKVSDSWFQLYAFLILAAYSMDYLEFLFVDGTLLSWWNDQRIWIIRGLSCQLYGTIDCLLKSLGISTAEFNVTSKVSDDEKAKRYKKGIMEFGVHSPMFVPLVMAALVNLASMIFGAFVILRGVGNWEGLVMQVVLSGFGVINGWPVYEAMVLRTDGGKLPAKTSVVAAFLAFGLYLLASLVMK